jgi:hypothetical protein
MCVRVCERRVSVVEVRVSVRVRKVSASWGNKHHHDRGIDYTVSRCIPLPPAVSRGIPLYPAVSQILRCIPLYPAVSRNISTLSPHIPQYIWGPDIIKNTPEHG